MSLEDGPVGILILFPVGLKIPTVLLKVPVNLVKENEGTLHVALVPWELLTKEIRAAGWNPRVPTKEALLDPAFSGTVAQVGSRAVSQRRFMQAIHILGFPKDLYDFFAMPNHPYCVWSGSDIWNGTDEGDNTFIGPGYETKLLKTILSTSGAQDLGYKANVRAVFVHVGALLSFQRLPALSERRMKQPDLRIFTYGTHPSVPRERWGVREIYPLGASVPQPPRRPWWYPLISSRVIYGRRHSHVHARCDHRGPLPPLRTDQEDRGAPHLGVLRAAVGGRHGRQADLSG